MRLTNSSSLPDTSSASAIAASLPDCTISPRTSSSTVTALRGSMNMREPAAFHARGDTFTICDGVIVLARSAANTTYAVISLVSDAGSRRSSALAAPSVCPLNVSTSTHDAAASAGAPSGPGAVTSGAGAAETCDLAGARVLRASAEGVKRMSDATSAQKMRGSSMNEPREERVIILPCMRKVVSNRMQPWRRTACLLALAAVACVTLPREGGRNELADAERAFAADCAARGIDASFIAHFAPDGLVFEPQPT